MPQRPIGTFHALPIARGKSCSSSSGSATWASSTDQPVPRREQRDHGWPRQPAGADRQHQEGPGERRPRLWGGPRVLRHQRHVDQQQDGRAGADEAGRHRHHRPQLPQVASLRHGAGRRPADLCRSLSAHALFDVRRGAAVGDQVGHAGLAGRRAARPLADPRSDELHVRRPHVQYAPGDGGMPRHQARPDLPVGRSLVGLCTLVAVPASAHGDGRCCGH